MKKVNSIMAIIMCLFIFAGCSESFNMLDFVAKPFTIFSGKNKEENQKTPSEDLISSMDKKIEVEGGTTGDTYYSKDILSLEYIKTVMDTKLKKKGESLGEFKEDEDLDNCYYAQVGSQDDLAQLEVVYGLNGNIEYLTIYTYPSTKGKEYFYALREGMIECMSPLLISKETEKTIRKETDPFDYAINTRGEIIHSGKVLYEAGKYSITESLVGDYDSMLYLSCGHRGY